MNQPTKPDSDFLPLPQYSIAQGGRKYYSEDAMHDYVITDRAARQPVAGSVDTPDWVVMVRPGMVPVRKGPFYDKKHVEDMLRDLYQLHPDCQCMVINMPHDCYPDSGIEWIDMHGDKRRKPIRELLAPAAPSDAESYDLPLGYFSQNGGTTYVEVDPKFKGDPDVIPLYTRPAPRDVDAPIVLPKKPKSQANGDNTCDYFGHLFEYTWKEVVAFATAAVQKDRANWKETK